MGKLMWMKCVWSFSRIKDEPNFDSERKEKGGLRNVMMI